MLEAGVKVQPDKGACNILVEKRCSAGETRPLAKILEYMNEKSPFLHKTVYLEAQKSLRNVSERPRVRVSSDKLKPASSIRHVFWICN